MSSTATKSTQIPFDPIREKLREAIEQYRKNHPEKSDEYKVFKKFLDVVKSEKVFDTRNINEEFWIQYRQYHGKKYDHVTWLELAVLLDSVELVQFMLEHGASVHVASPDIDHRGSITALHRAAEKGNVAIVKLLIDNGAKVNAKQFMTDQTPLHFAAHYGYGEVVKILVESGAEVNAENVQDATPLHFAARRGHTEIVKILLKSGAYVNVDTKGGLTPLHSAVQGGHTEIVKILLKSGAYVNAETQSGDTALHFAATYGYRTTAQVLVKSGAKVNVKNNDGLTAIENARKSGYSEIAYYLESFAEKNYQVEDNISLFGDDSPGAIDSDN